MFEAVKEIFKREDKEKSKDVAKERLRLVLVHDRMDRMGISRDVLNDMKEDLIEVISKHLEIDQKGLEINFERQDKDSVALEANIPIKNEQQKE
ncbi:cell division topological specificity factor MinE [Halanaerobacter jeridensis]|uniref:Cell division topological specificity factor n=1 Tax=Halanaerobacter jeridensis TaxID=706427 RepID=A0A938XV75_9FIRM|nr:cell division topological specificity factor MinE [Halanaerobacter jeridensis]MBM7556187.1 cell division topological specificity factor [Halanaerobacter jeridensis]